MGIRNPFKSETPVFATLKITRALLGFSISTVFFCLFGLMLFILVMAFNYEVSQIRREMNSAMYEAQRNFYQRESFLEYINRAVVTRVEGVDKYVVDKYISPNEHTYIELDGSRGLKLILSGRDLQLLKMEHIGLVFLDLSNEIEVMRIFGGEKGRRYVSSDVIQTLAVSTASRVWVAPKAESRVYLFSRVPGQEDIWIGLDVPKGVFLSELMVGMFDNYQLIDSSHRVISSSFESYPDGNQDLSVVSVSSDGFFFTGTSSLLPQSIILLKHLGDSGWLLIYYFDIGSLLHLMWPWLFSLWCILFFAGGCIWWIFRRTNNRLLKPAAKKLDILLESEAFSRAVIQTAPVALCIVRRSNAEVVMENNLSQQWLGLSEDRKQWLSGLLESACGYTEINSSFHDVYEVSSCAGRSLSLSYTPTRYQGEEVICLAFSDVTARKQIEIRLAEAKQMADVANEAKSQFLATMSHEIRTPLYGVLGTLELLLRTPLSRQQESYLQAICSSSATLNHLISDVLDVTRIEAGMVQIESIEFSPLELSMDLVKSFVAAANAKGVQMYCCCDPKMPRFIRGDIKHLRQVLNNLLGNAVKFTDVGYVVLHVSAEFDSDSHVRILWRVVDTGVGVPAEEQALLFNPFYQGAKHTRIAGGAGLGLSICKKLSDLMDADLRVESGPDEEGSIFSLCISFGVVPSTNLSGLELNNKFYCVYAPVPEVAENICSWIEHWGGRASMLLSDQVPNNAVLVDLSLLALGMDLQPEWKGCRVVLSDQHGEQAYRDGQTTYVGRFNLVEMQRAFALAQGQLLRSELYDNEYAGGTLSFRILVVEDNPINKMVLCEQLETLGCSVQAVGDGKQALISWNESFFDIVITDVNMPDMSGYELARELRHQGCLIPVIGVTANAMKGESQRCMAAGMNLCLVKPIDLGELYQCLVSVTLEAEYANPNSSSRG
ncbi:TPA: response regulator [Pseudomonas aeruginosa]